MEPSDLNELFEGRVAIKESELCKALGISRAAAFNLRQLGKLDYFEDGRMIRYGKHHIINYLKSIETSNYDRADR